MIPNREIYQLAQLSQFASDNEKSARRKFFPPLPNLRSPCKSRAINFSVFPLICNILSENIRNMQQYSPDRVELVILIIILYSFNIQNVQISPYQARFCDFSAFSSTNTPRFEKVRLHLWSITVQENAYDALSHTGLRFDQIYFIGCSSPLFHSKLNFQEIKRVRTYKCMSFCPRRNPMSDDVNQDDDSLLSWTTFESFWFHI